MRRKLKIQQNNVIFLCSKKDEYGSVPYNRCVEKADDGVMEQIKLIYIKRKNIDYSIVEFCNKNIRKY